MTDLLCKTIGRDESRPYIKIFLALLIGAALTGCAGDYTEEEFVDDQVALYCKKSYDCDQTKFYKDYLSLSQCRLYEKENSEQIVCPDDYIFHPGVANDYLDCWRKMDCIMWVIGVRCEELVSGICTLPVIEEKPDEFKPHKECLNILDCDEGKECVDGKCV